MAGISEIGPHPAPLYAPLNPASGWEMAARGVASFVGALMAGVGGWALQADEESPFVRELGQEGAAASLAAGGALVSLSLITWIARKGIERGQGFSSASVEEGYQAEGATYESADPRGVADIAYANPNKGFAFVVDGTGHGNPLMRPPLAAHFESFAHGYEKGLNSLEPPTFEAVVAHFQAQMQDLAVRFRDTTLPLNKVKVTPENPTRPDFDLVAGTLCDPSYAPALSVAQVVRLKGKDILLTGQAGDTMIVVHTKNGTLATTQHAKAGESVRDPGPKVAWFDITGAKRVIGFSDGIGEFLPWTVFQRIVQVTPSDQLFDALRNAIVSSKNTLHDSSRTPRSSAGMHSASSANRDGSPKSRRGSPKTPRKGANGLRLKSFDAGDHNKADDIGLFALDLEKSS